MFPNGGGWKPPLAYDGGYVKTTNIFNKQTVTKKIIIWKEYTEKQFPIQNKKNWIPPDNDYTLKVTISLFGLIY